MSQISELLVKRDDYRLELDWWSEKRDNNRLKTGYRQHRESWDKNESLGQDKEILLPRALSLSGKQLIMEDEMG